MSKQCPNCLGEGLIGSGDVPHLKLGNIRTCDVCNGTGIVADGYVLARGNPVVPEPVKTPVDTTVDNSTLTASSSLSSADRRIAPAVLPEGQVERRVENVPFQY